MLLLLLLLLLLLVVVVAALGLGRWCRCRLLLMLLLSALGDLVVGACAWELGCALGSLGAAAGALGACVLGRRYQMVWPCALSCFSTRKRKYRPLAGIAYRDPDQSSG